VHRAEPVITHRSLAAFFDRSGEKWLVNLKSGKGSVAKGEGAADPTVTMSDDTFFQISQGKMNAQQVRHCPYGSEGRLSPTP
jgi:putative sterol carrier protein